MKRKIVQISGFQGNTQYFAALVVLCDDGTVWRKRLDEGYSWMQISTSDVDGESPKTDLPFDTAAVASKGRR